MSELAWQQDALCQYEPADLWSIETRVSRRNTHQLELVRRQIEAAKAICNECPVIRECLDYALRTRERYGIWGGKTPKERGIR